MSSQQSTLVYAAYAVFNVMVAKEVNDLVLEPYMVSNIKRHECTLLDTLIG